MENSQKYTLVAFLEPHAVGTEFEMADWPLHVTLADVFAVSLDAALEQELAELFAKQPPLILLTDEDATLGTTKVALIHANKKLQNLHLAVVDLLESKGATFNTPEFTREGFLPHSTIQKSGRLNKGDEIRISSISLVDMFPGGDWQQRKILRNYTFREA